MFVKVLWVSNLFIGAVADKHSMKQTSGQWLNAELEYAKVNPVNDIVVCTSGDTSEFYVDGNISYRVLPHGNVTSYDVTEEHIADWKRFLLK